MELNGWTALVSGLALWLVDAIRVWWNGLTWRDVLLLLILLGLWGALRELGLILSRVHEVREKLDDMNELTRLFLRRRDEKVDKIERILGVK